MHELVLEHFIYPVYLLPKIFKLFGFNSLVTMSVPDGDYSRNVPSSLYLQLFVGVCMSCLSLYLQLFVGVCMSCLSLYLLLFVGVCMSCFSLYLQLFVGVCMSCFSLYLLLFVGVCMSCFSLHLLLFVAVSMSCLRCLCIVVSNTYCVLSCNQYICCTNMLYE